MSQICADRRWVERKCKARNCPQRVELGRKGKGVPLARPVQRLDTEAIARHVQDSRSAIEHGKRKEAIRTFQSSVNSEPADGLDKDLRVGRTAKAHAELACDFPCIVKLAVIGNDEA